MEGWKIFRNGAFFFFVKLLMGEVRAGTKALCCFALKCNGLFRERGLYDK